jgi:acyl-ACP thioesterase
MNKWRSYQQMTADEKRHSIFLWKKFYDSLMRNDHVNSWKYWHERQDYLQEIGIDTTHPLTTAQTSMDS